MKQFLKNRTLKTKNMKARLNQIILATFLIFILLSGNVNATGTEVIVASDLENITETKLELESWMTDEAYWIAADYEKEEMLVLETWMLDEKKWEVPVYVLSLETDQSLILKEWMLNEMYWN
jgi:hypothetical protein